MENATEGPRLAYGETESDEEASLLDVANLHVHFDTGRDVVRAVDGVSFSIRRGEIFGIVGESGSGKSATLRALIGLLPDTGARTAGRVEYAGRNLLDLDERGLQRVRGAEISMVFQDPMTFLNPVLRVREQIEEALRQHTTLGRAERQARAVELMRLVGIALPERRLREYPHQFSGGMRQRVLIAIALACSPKVLLADEPTTALDVTIQDQILKLLKRLRDELGMSIVLVSHDLGVIAQTCERVAVMYAGQIVESAPVRELIRNPRHPYTLGLLNSLPRVDAASRYLVPIPGQPPTLTEHHPGCRFADRCPLVLDECRGWQTELLEAMRGHRTRCLRHEIVGSAGG
jgi:peptide/nickel transport system ATP-binding protein/oligopeptide transport system ATP-binding protein